MGALTLAIVVPAGPSMPIGGGESDGASRASSATSIFEVEAQSAADLREAARTLGLACEVVVVPAHSDQTDFEVRPVAEVMRRRLGHADRVLIAAHANLGGSGRLHASAWACGLPVVGPEGLAIGRAYDKLLARQVLRRNNIPVPRTVALGSEVGRPRLELDRLGWPAILKPRWGAGSLGVQRIASPDAIDSASSALSQDVGVIIEREVRGRELSVVVLGGRVLGIAELDRTFCEKTGRLQTHAMICPAELDSRREAGLANLALRACSSLQLGTGPTRVDLLVSERDNEVVLEVEPLPPLHRDGIVARVARAAGLSYPQLCAQILATLATESRSRATPTRRPATAEARL